MIHERYTLFTRIPLFAGPRGEFRADELWEKDLSAHLAYLAEFRICCPVEEMRRAPARTKLVAGLSAEQITPLLSDRSWGSAIANIVPNFLKVAGAARQSEIVHSGGAGWFFPLSYYLLLLRLFLRFRWVMVIESTFWMKPPGGTVSPRQWLRHHVSGFLIRRCVRAADARIFTHDGYRRAFLESCDAALVAAAVWVDEANLRDPDDLAQDLSGRSGPPRLLFPARLIPEKGIETVLTAVDLLDARRRRAPGPVLHLDIMGEGPLAGRCREFVARRVGGEPVAMRFLDPLPYGEPFFGALRTYDAVIVANRQAEQPRIVFDAFSQGLPCIATRTSGNMDITREDETALLFPIDDAGALADILDRVATAPVILRRMAAAALATARGKTHEAMHRDRERFLRQVLGLRES